MVEGRGLYRILVGKPEGKRPLGRPRRRWEDNIKINLQEVVGYLGVRIGSNWLRIRHCVTNRQFAGLIPDGVIGIFH